MDPFTMRPWLGHDILSGYSHENWHYISILMLVKSCEITFVPNISAN